MNEIQGGKNAEKAHCTTTVPMQAKKCVKQLRTMQSLTWHLLIPDTSYSDQILNWLCPVYTNLFH